MGTTSDKIHISKFHDNGIFEYSGLYTEMFIVEQVHLQGADIFNHKMEQLYLKMPKDCVFQMIVHNTLIEKEDYLKTILVSTDKMPQAEIYDKTILDVVDIGCNNVKKCVYLVVGYNAASIDKAKEYFHEQNLVIEKAFDGVEIRKLDTLERLEVLYHAFNPKKNAFGYELDLRNDGNIQLSNLKHLKMTEKDLIAPKRWNTKESLRNHTILDEGLETQCYSRTMFLNCIPKEVSINVISDLTSVSGNMLFSVFYNPVDAELGFDTVSEEVKKNTFVTKKQKRDTIQDKKNKTSITFTDRKVINENVYFHEAALDSLKRIKASRGTIMEISAVITLFSDTLEELERNMEMLKISAAKFACSVKCLNKLQYEGFYSSLPLCEQKVNVSRFLSSERLAQMSPITAVAKGNRFGGAYLGLNAINDNMVIYNRKQNINLSGVICGTEHSGKTYQVKREILNTMLTTIDNVNIITYGNEYDQFIKSLGGDVEYLSELNPFYITNGYGFIKQDKIAKLSFLTAFGNNAEEAESLIKEDIDFSVLDNVLNVIIKDNAYPRLTEALTAVNEAISRQTGNSKRLSLYKVSNKAELLVTMEYLWNQSVDDKKKNLTNWLFIDAVDELLKKETSLDYLLNYLENYSNIHNVATIVIQDAVGLMENRSIAVEELVTGCGYVKLLNQGPIERKRFTDILNIPNALVPYITNVEPGQGLIITPISNVAFNDNFLDIGNSFTEIFKK